jgi:DNA-binding transcriptional ArsR family regulator
MHVNAMETNGETGSRTQDVLACLAVPSRYRLVLAIAGADLCVGELAISVGLSQSCTTRHLQALERVGLVEGRRDGRRVNFRLRADAAGPRSVLELVLGGAGTSRGQDPGDEHPGAPSDPPARRHSGDTRRAKPLPKEPFADGRGEASARREAGTAARVRAPDEAPHPAPEAPTRPFRRPDIEDYLL